MDIERIEYALREGPPDEPVYVPGSFGRSHAPAWWFAVAGMLVTAAVVTGIAIGVGLDALRGNPVGGPTTPEVTAADLEGRWLSDEIPMDEWVDELLANGFDPNDIGNFLAHDPFEQSVRYQLTFDSGNVTVSADYDGTGLQVLNSGEYSIQGGVLSYVETTDAPPVVGEACRVRAVPTLDDLRIVWEDVELAGCGVDPSIAHTAFFDLAGYTQVVGD
jgi:hypothetical protein